MNLRSILLIAIGVAASAGTTMAAPPLRLFEIFAERIIDDQGTPIFDRGLLNALGEFKHDIFAQLPPGTTVPPEAMNRNLVPLAVLIGYDVLGPEALNNFKFDSTVTIGGQGYAIVTVADQPKLDVGTLVNISARGVITPGSEPLIGGFIIEDHPRHVLLRGVGPTLSAYGVVAPLANPTITVFRHDEQTGFVANDDWSQQADADEIEAATVTAGAFALPRASKDAALLIELPPGAYTAHLSTADATGGTALLEIYTLP